jgi:hypothetical protein
MALFFMSQSAHGTAPGKEPSGLVGVTIKALNWIASATKRAKTEKISAQVGQLLQKYKLCKFVIWSVADGRLV